MDVREKIVELVKNSLRAYGKDLEKTVEPFEFIADFLISNGVTVQGVTDNNVGCKWISVDDRLPEDDSDVIAYLRTGEEGRIFPANYARGGRT